MSLLDEPFHLRPLGDCVATDGCTSQKADRQHAEQRPGTRLRVLGQCHEFPERSVVPLLRTRPEVHHDDAGWAPLGAVTILISTTSPQPITAYTTIATSDAVSNVFVLEPVS